MVRLADDLLADAVGVLMEPGLLLRSPGQRGRLNQVRIRRAISAAYYGVFHTLCALVADSLVGRVRVTRPNRAWAQAYRSLEHRKAKDRLEKLLDRDRVGTLHGFPPAIAGVAIAFKTLQEERHRADYDPDANFHWIEAVTLVRSALQAVSSLDALPKVHAKALAIWLLLDPPRR
jgi:hypothetical protein